MDHHALLAAIVLGWSVFTAEVRVSLHTPRHDIGHTSILTRVAITHGVSWLRDGIVPAGWRLVDVAGTGWAILHGIHHALVCHVAMHVE